MELLVTFLIEVKWPLTLLIIFLLLKGNSSLKKKRENSSNDQDKLRS
jgi:hypothetical protein